MIISQASLSAKHGMYKVESILPYRLLRALVDKPEVGLPVLDVVMFDLVCCLRQQISDLGGLVSSQTKGTKVVKVRGAVVEDASKKPSKKGALKAEILQSSNLFFSSLDSEVIWKWATELLRGIFKRQQRRDVVDAAISRFEQESRQVANEREEENVEEGKVRTRDLEDSLSSSLTIELDKVHEGQLTEKLVHKKLENSRNVEEREKEGERHAQSANQKTTSKPTSVVDTKQDFSFVMELIKFLIQSLPLVSDESARTC